MSLGKGQALWHYSSLERVTITIIKLFIYCTVFDVLFFMRPACVAKFQWHQSGQIYFLQGFQYLTEESQAKSWTAINWPIQAYFVFLSQPHFPTFFRKRNIVKTKRIWVNSNYQIYFVRCRSFTTWLCSFFYFFTSLFLQLSHTVGYFL